MIFANICENAPVLTLVKVRLRTVNLARWESRGRIGGSPHSLLVTERGTDVTALEHQICQREMRICRGRRKILITYPRGNRRCRSP